MISAKANLLQQEHQALREKADLLQEESRLLRKTIRAKEDEMERPGCSTGTGRIKEENIG